jgi:hypothetical protein
MKTYAFQTVIVEDKPLHTKNYTVCDTAHNVVENSFSKAQMTKEKLNKK